MEKPITVEQLIEELQKFKPTDTVLMLYKTDQTAQLVGFEKTQYGFFEGSEMAAATIEKMAEILGMGYASWDDKEVIEAAINEGYRFQEGGTPVLVANS